MFVREPEAPRAHTGGTYAPHVYVWHVCNYTVCRLSTAVPWAQHVFEQPRSARLPSRTLVHKFYPKAYSYHPSWFVLMSRPSLTCAIQSDIRCTVVLALSSGANVIRSGRLLSRRLLRRKRRCERALRRPEAARTQPETGSASLGRPTAPCWPRAADDQLRR